MNMLYLIAIYTTCYACGFKYNWHPYEYITLYFFRNVRCFRVLLLTIYTLAGAILILGDNGYFASTGKPLQCHEIRPVHFRSIVECALHCFKHIYSCAGYVYTSKEDLDFHCHICFIYDIANPFVIVNASNNATSIIPDINQQTGKTPCVFLTDRSTNLI